MFRCGYCCNFFSSGFNHRISSSLSLSSSWSSHYQGPDFDEMSFFFPSEIDDAIQYINLGYGAQVSKNSYFIVHFIDNFN